MKCVFPEAGKSRDSHAMRSWLAIAEDTPQASMLKSGSVPALSSSSLPTIILPIRDPAISWRQSAMPLRSSNSNTSSLYQLGSRNSMTCGRRLGSAGTCRRIPARIPIGDPGRQQRGQAKTREMVGVHPARRAVGQPDQTALFNGSEKAQLSALRFLET